MDITAGPGRPAFNPFSQYGAACVLLHEHKIPEPFGMVGVGPGILGVHPHPEPAVSLDSIPAVERGGLDDSRLGATRELLKIRPGYRDFQAPAVVPIAAPVQGAVDERRHCTPCLQFALSANAEQSFPNPEPTNAPYSLSSSVAASAGVPCWSRGLRLCQSVARSYALAMASTRASENRGPAIMSPTGSPVAVIPHRTDMAA